jgi:hypothetical protein
MRKENIQNTCFLCIFFLLYMHDWLDPPFVLTPGSALTAMQGSKFLESSSVRTMLLYNTREDKDRSKETAA